MASIIEVLTTLLTFCGLAYLLLALWGARSFQRDSRKSRSAHSGAQPVFPDVSILKPLKGLDPRMYAGFVSHCRQDYAGRFEILFGVNSLDDPAVVEIRRLQAEFPDVAIVLVECTERLGTSGKLSSLIQLLRRARYDHILVNDSDIRVGAAYLTNVMRGFAAQDVQANLPALGLVSALYLGRTAAEGGELTVWSRLEALGISTDFIPGVLTARKLEG